MMRSKLDAVCRLISEEVQSRRKLVEDELKMFFSDKSSSENKNVISQDLKIRKKNGPDAGTLYTVDQVGSWGVTVYRIDVDGSKKMLKVDRETLEKDYEL